MTMIDNVIERMEELVFELDQDLVNTDLVREAEEILGLINEMKYGTEEEATNDPMEELPSNKTYETLSPKTSGTSGVGRKSK